MTVTVVSTTNNGDGTYTITFSEPIINTNPGTNTPDPNILLFSPALNDWVVAITNAAEIGSTIVVEATGDPVDCTFIILLNQPLDLTAADLFEICSPQITPS